MENPFKLLAFNLVKKYRHSTVSQWIIFLFDVLLFVAAFAITEIFRYVSNGSVDATMRTMVVKFVIALMLTLIFFLLTGSFRGIIRHAGMSDIWKILVANIR